MLYIFLVIVLFYVLASQYAVNESACPQCVGYADLAAKYGCGCKQEEYSMFKQPRCWHCGKPCSGDTREELDSGAIYCGKCDHATSIVKTLPG